MRNHFIGSAITTVSLGLTVVAASLDGVPAMITMVGRWVLMPDGQAAPSDEFLRGLQTSGLAFDGELLWSVGDQRSAYPGHLLAIDPASGRLNRAPIPLSAREPAIRDRLSGWGRLDLEGITVLSSRERRFVAVLEDEDTAAVVLQLDESGRRAVVEAIWDFEFPGGRPPEPYRHDTNYRLEAIAVDSQAMRGYVGFERDFQGRPHLYEFDVRSAAQRGISPVPLEELKFEEWASLGGKPRTQLNVNGLEFSRTASGDPRLYVLCRDRELIFTMDPRSGKLISQLALQPMSPDGEPIEWASPEGIAIDERRGILYVVSDPDSTDGNWRLRRTRTADGNFALFVPLLFQCEIPAELTR